MAAVVEELDERRLEVAGRAHGRLELGRRAAEQQLPVGEDEHAVGVALGLPDVVRREHHGRAAAGEAADELPQDLALARVQRRRGLVEQEHRRIGEQADRDVHALLVAAGETAELVALPVGQAGELERAGDELGKLSGGNKQRVNIAIGLLADPPVLLLDEPSSALDPRHRLRVWTFLDRKAEAGTTILFATHDLAEAARHGDGVLVLADGEVLFTGTPAELETEVGAGRDFESAFVEFLKARGH